MPRATTISEELEGIGCLSTEECRKKTIVQLYNHYSTTPLFMYAIVRATVVSTLVNSLYREWISIYSFIGH